MSLKGMSTNVCRPCATSSMTRVAVFAGGDKSHYRTDFDLFVGVDGGARWLLEQNLPLDFAVGDFDSVSPTEFEQIGAQAGKLVTAQPEKDDTDLELALLTVFADQPQAQVTIFGAFGGRIDHTLATVFLPSNDKLAPFLQQIQLEDGQNLLCYRGQGTSSVEPIAGYDYLAFMPVQDCALTIRGAKYDLDESNFFFKKVYASNEFIGREVQVTCPAGYVVVMYSRDWR